MEKREYMVYKFDELTDEQQEKAIERNLDINVGFDWWECTEGDAKGVGIEIESFDLYRHDIRGRFIDSPLNVIRLILKNHGKKTETYKTARSWKSKIIKGIRENDDEPAKEFLRDILEDYRILLDREYDYLTSGEAIVETLRSNEYDFTVDGRIDRRTL